MKSNELVMKKITIAVMGLGYVGFPLADALSKSFDIIGYDISKEKITSLREKNKKIIYTNDSKKLKQADAIIVCVPTPALNCQPDLSYIEKACKAIGKNISLGTLVIFESSYMPYCTQTYCIPIIEEYSNLKYGTDFFVGYSPERINPGDKNNTLNSITKIIASPDADTLKKMETIYSSIEGLKLYKVDSFEVAEFCKLFENTQRDINVAFMNEMAQLCHSIGIDINQVIAAAKTKWNYVDFYPGLVGGDCIGVNPYYLMNIADKNNVKLDLIKVGRTINSNMPNFIINELLKMICDIDSNWKGNNIKITIYGYTYKENVNDTRNTRVKDIYNELKKYDFNIKLCDYLVDSNDANFSKENTKDNDIIILAVPHEQYSNWNNQTIIDMFKKESKYKIFMDLKSVYKDLNNTNSIKYWSI